MANNRMWLIHRPSGKAIILGKRMAVGWYTNGRVTSELLDAFFDSLEGDQDDFVLGMEDISGAPKVAMIVKYDNHMPVLKEGD